MAISQAVKREEQFDDIYLSDESDFYGDETTKSELELRADELDVQDWWKHKQPSLMEIAQKNLKNSVTSKKIELHNPYEGRDCARQLGETVDEFLERLPPATTMQIPTAPWIFIANPYIERSLPDFKGDFREGDPEEGPTAGDSDWARFVRVGTRLLEELTSLRVEFEKKNVGKAKQTITKALAPHKDEVVKQLLDEAAACHCTSGKWMMFCDSRQVNEVWATIARGTANNELGIAAKVARDVDEDAKPRLVCVYTKDFTDTKDLVRVASKLKEYGLIEARGKPIYYKCDAYTYLHLNSGNEYNIKASLYSSAEILSSKPQAGKDGKVSDFFSRKK